MNEESKVHHELHAGDYELLEEGDFTSAGDLDHLPIPPRRELFSPDIIKSLKFVGIIFLCFLAGILILRLVAFKTTSADRTTYNFILGTAPFSPISAGAEAKGKAELVRNVPGSNQKGCLQFTYENEVDKFIGVGTIKPDMKNFREIKVRIKSEKDRIFAISVDELTGEVFVFPFQLRAGIWSEISARPDQFLPSGGNKTGDKKLDIAHLNSRLVIADISGDNGTIGPNKFWIDLVEIIK